MNKRYNARQALKHRWILKYDRKIRLPKQRTQALLDNIMAYEPASKFQHQAWSFMVMKFAKRDEIRFINKVFWCFDKNADGFITKDEFNKGCEKIMGFVDAGKVDQVFAKIN